MMQISIVPTEYVDTCWEKIRTYMEGAAKYTYGRYTADDIKDSITQYDHHLWVAFEGTDIKGAVVTNFMFYPRRKYLSLVFCGGMELKTWKGPMLETLQRFARDTNCNGIESTGRRGWAKVFKNDGYKSMWAAYELPI
jgi:hypothetical protein